jgi:hypothetical protein
MHFDFEAQYIGVEGDHCLDIVYDVPNTDFAHIFTFEMDWKTVTQTGGQDEVYRLADKTKEQRAEFQARTFWSKN